MFCFDQTHLLAFRYERSFARSERMKCLHLPSVARAEEKLAQADRDHSHRKRLNKAAEGWLLLASRLRQIEASVVATKDRPKRRRCVGSAQQEMKPV